MAEFKAYLPGVEVKGFTIINFLINSMRRDKEYRVKVLEKHGIINPKEDEFYPIEPFLGAIKEVYDTQGEINTYLMGLSGIRSMQLPPVSLKDMLLGMNVVHHTHHRLNGKIMFDEATGEFTAGAGAYELLEFNEKERFARIRMSTFYAAKNEEGVLMGVLEKYKPADSKFIEVKEDITQPRKSQGGDSTTFILRW
jgi:hypothetical protein